jgi:hypothetical protein
LLLLEQLRHVWVLKQLFDMLATLHSAETKHRDAL